ncbi:MAG: HEAT repeat domain-containing protein [Planctomycetes bacterium]|nr:HEAT repeat domain-containing protein [Planctomycetota bacterium]
MIPLGLAFCLLFAPQAPELVDQLRSDRIEERELAMKKLKELGQAALPELEKAARDKDVEVAGRAQGLLRRLTLIGQLTPNLIKVLPGIEERLDLGDDCSWTKVFLEAAAVGSGEQKLPLRKEDLEVLIARALRGASKNQDEIDVVIAAGEWRLRSAAPAILDLFRQDCSFRSCAVDALVRMDARKQLLEIARLDDKADPALGRVDSNLTHAAFQGLAEAGAQEELLLLLEDTDSPLAGDAACRLGELKVEAALPKVLALTRAGNPYIRERAATALADSKSEEALPALIRLLGDTYGHPRRGAILALGKRGATSEIPRIVPLLQDKRSSVRAAALDTISTLGARAQIADIAKSVRDEEPYVRTRAVAALESLAGRESVDAISGLLADADAGVRYLAAASLCRLGSKRGAQVLIQEAARGKPFAFGYGDEIFSAGAGGDPLLLPLNALLNKPAWDRLAAATLVEESTGGTREDLEQCANIVGAALEFSAKTSKPSGDEERGRYRLDGYPAGTPVLELLERLLWNAGWELVLEDDRLRVCSRDEALRFWRERQQ